MNIEAIDHFTIRTNRPDETTAFFSQVVGLVEGPRPAFRFPGKWLYANGHPILHIVVARSESDDRMEAYLGRRERLEGSGCLDHISLRGRKLAEMQQHLTKLGQHFRERIIPGIGEHQLFIEDPNGVTIEMIFPYSPDDDVLGEAIPTLEVDS